MPHHLLTGQHTVFHMTCGNCRKWWDRAGVNASAPGTIICPHCNRAAPTDIDPKYAESTTLGGNEGPCSTN